jgi:hypothetical protein
MMRHTKSWAAVALVIAGLALLPACAKAEPEVGKDESAKVEQVKGTNLNRVILSAEAAKRLGIQTAPVRDIREANGAPRKAVPYAAVLYDADGKAVTYTNPEPLVYVMSPITIDHIENDTAMLSDGPPTGTPVVTVGATELFGVESGVSEE